MREIISCEKTVFLKMELKYTENLIATLLGLYLKGKAGAFH
jgi:hypothetical protein